MLLLIYGVYLLTLSNRKRIVWNSVWNLSIYSGTLNGGAAANSATVQLVGSVKGSHWATQLSCSVGEAGLHLLHFSSDLTNTVLLRFDCIPLKQCLYLCILKFCNIVFLERDVCSILNLLGPTLSDWAHFERLAAKRVTFWIIWTLK